MPTSPPPSRSGGDPGHISDHGVIRTILTELQAGGGGGGVVFVGKRSGALTVLAGTARIYNDTGRTLTITAVRTFAETPPTGAAILVDVNKNGTTIFTTQGNRPSIAASGTTSGKVTNMDITTLTDGDYLTFDVDQIGSTIAGADLTAQVTCS